MSTSSLKVFIKYLLFGLKGGERYHPLNRYLEKINYTEDQISIVHDHYKFSSRIGELFSYKNNFTKDYIEITSIGEIKMGVVDLNNYRLEMNTW